MNVVDEMEDDGLMFSEAWHMLIYIPSQQESGTALLLLPMNVTTGLERNNLVQSTREGSCSQQLYIFI